MRGHVWQAVLTFIPQNENVHLKNVLTGTYFDLLLVSNPIITSIY